VSLRLSTAPEGDIQGQKRVKISTFPAGAHLPGGDGLLPNREPTGQADESDRIRLHDIRWGAASVTWTGDALDGRVGRNAHFDGTSRMRTGQPISQGANDDAHGARIRRQFLLQADGDCADQFGNEVPRPIRGPENACGYEDLSLSVKRRRDRGGIETAWAGHRGLGREGAEQCRQRALVRGA
jgi:hypothetical protein